MCRRAGVVAAHGCLELAEHIGRRRRVLTDHRQPAYPLAVQREDFRERVTDQRSDTCVGHRPDGIDVFVDAFAEALIGDIQEGDELTILDHFDQAVPLRHCQIGTGRVMAARVQQEDALRRQPLHRVEHGLEPHATRLGIEVRVRIDLEARPAEQRVMVFPGRVTHPDLRIRKRVFEEIGTYLQRARAAHGLNGGDAACLNQRVIGAEQQGLHRLPIRRQAFHRQVHGRCLFAFGQLLLRCCHACQLRNAALCVVIQADAQIDLVRTRVLAKGLHQRKDRITGV